jgi:serine/threonine protein kinase
MSIRLFQSFFILLFIRRASSSGENLCPSLDEFNKEFKQQLRERSFIDLWEREERLGKGSQGEVRVIPWYLKEGTFRTEIAVKKANPEHLSHLVTEIKLMKSFQQQNLKRQIEYIACVTNNGFTYLLMEKMDGILKSTQRPSLNNQFYYNSFQKFTPIKRLNVYYQIFMALGELHKANIKHQDIKPENIMWKYENGEINVKIVDFGLATDINGEIYAGTYPYIDKVKILMYSKTSGSVTYPEIKNRKDFHLADIWAAGVSIFELENGAWFAETPYKQINFLNTEPNETQKRFELLRKKFTSPVWMDKTKINICKKDKTMCFSDVMNRIFKQREVSDEVKTVNFVNEALIIAKDIHALISDNRIPSKVQDQKVEKQKNENPEEENDNCFSCFRNRYRSPRLI